MAEIAAQSLLKTPTVEIRDVYLRGTMPARQRRGARRRHPPRVSVSGRHVRHLAGDEAVAEANQVLFFIPAEGYRVSHPVEGGDASLDLVLAEPLLRELTPRALLRGGGRFAFRAQRQRIDARAQALVALLRHSLRAGIAEPLEAEGLALTLVRRSARPAHQRERQALGFERLGDAGAQAVAEQRHQRLRPRVDTLPLGAEGEPATSAQQRPRRSSRSSGSASTRSRLASPPSTGWLTR